MIVLHLEETASKTVIENESGQITYCHVRHGGAGGDEQNEKILFLQFDILDD